MPATLVKRRGSQSATVVGKDCSNECETVHSNEKYSARIRRINGQVSGIERMIAGNRYCPEILMQIRAAKSALHSLELQLLESHLRGCVTVALQSSTPQESEKKIKELLEILK